MKYLLSILSIASCCATEDIQWKDYWESKPRLDDYVIFIFKIDGVRHGWAGNLPDFMCYVRDAVDGSPIYWIELPEVFK
jgi:hypothetical protein